MADLEKIQQLLDTRTKENNYLAMCLMLKTLGLSFDQAFLKLQWSHTFYYPNYFAVEMSGLTIYYSNGYIIDSEGWWYQILENEKIVKEDELLFAEYTISKEASLSSFVDGKAIGEFAIFQEDLKIILPRIKELFYNNLII